MMTDPIADMLTRIRNASMIKKKEVCVPFSKIKLAIANILLESGYLAKVEEKKDIQPSLVLTLKYHNKQPAIQHIKRVSKPGHRVYIKSDGLRDILNGFGISIVSTPKGLMTNNKAKKEKMGGEIICEVY